MEKITVIGTTTWGTTLAIHIAKKGIPVCLLTRTKEETSKLTSSNENTRFLQGGPKKRRIRKMVSVLRYYFGRY